MSPDSGHGGYIVSESAHSSQQGKPHGLENQAEDIYTHPYLSGKWCFIVFMDYLDSTNAP